MATFVDIPFMYRARVVLRRCRNEVDVAMRDHVTVKVADPGTAALSAVLHRAEGARHAEPEVPYWETPSGLVAPLLYLNANAEGRAGPRVLTMELLGQLCAGHKTPFVRHPASQGEVAAEMRRGDPVRRRISDRRDEAAAEVVRTFKGACLVSGVVAVPSDGPQWVVRHDGGPRLEAADGRLAWNHRTYRADRRGDAADAATGAAGTRPGAVPARGHIDVLRPTAFRFDDDWAALRAASAGLVGALSPFVGSLPRDAAIAYLDLRDALVAWPVRRDGAAAGLAARALSAIDGRTLAVTRWAGQHDPRAAVSAAFRRLGQAA